MNPIILRLGIGVIVAVVACVTAFRISRRQQAQLQPPLLSSFDGSGITNCCICLEQLPVNESGLVSLPCKHKFHRCCIETVFSAETYSHNCPLCRKKVTSAFVASILQKD